MVVAAREAALTSGLALMLPDAGQTKLLRAALFRDEAGRRALADVASALERPQRLPPSERLALRSLSPLLECRTAVPRTAAPRTARAVGVESARVLRMATARERMRYETVRRLTRALLAAMSGAGIDPILLRGIVLAETVYPEPFRRHTHDIDLFVPPAELQRAEDAARSAGFTERAADPDRLPGGIRLVHPSGLPVELHSSLFLDPLHPAEIPGMTLRARRRELLGADVRTLGAADQLVHICGGASGSPVRGSLRWVADAWLLIDSEPDLDWDVVVRGAEAAHLSLALSAMLRYLAEELDSPIPSHVLDQLDALARDASPLARDVALYGARAGLPALALIRRARGGLHSKLWALSWLLFPSAPYLRHAYRGRRLPLPLLYAYRICHHASAALRERLRRVSMPGSLEAEIA
jgi:hypothetical protein